MARAAIALITLALLGGRAHAADVIEHVNRAVNGLELAETVEWGTGPVAGGCRRYAEEKRRRLLAAGIADGRMRLWLVSTPRGLHEVLVVDGARVLDNLFRGWTEERAALERQAGYVFLHPTTPPGA